MMRPIAIAFGFTALMTAGAYAAPFCIDSTRGIEVAQGFTIGDDFDEDDLNNFDLMQLRQLGVDATRVERWNGCIRAFVKKESGVGEEMQFFQPGSYQRVY
ncbi:hypothetical protein ASG47_09765 [Devosia sp. Leaf420]|uniref:hypothetical protein n=1 Tax=Devosia sp. Leaf420 TaxID=1736374 RepID=UPI0007129C94|nr:hypothetical protein [Devosia sp. Leaf420]KQT46894.1 hypothetical protein ASG47_09765 [Devosia sp. Leaf420]